MKQFLNSYIFWTCSLYEGGCGFWYHHWRNWITRESHDVFAGYSKRALNKKRSTWQTIKERINEQD